MLVAKRRSSNADDTSGNSPLLAVISKLVQDGAAWLLAEVAVGRAEAQQVLRQYLWAAAWAVTGFILLLTALIIVAQGAADALGRYMDNPLVAALLVGLVLALVAAVLLLAAARKLRPRRPVGSRVLKLFTGESVTAGGFDG